MKGVLNKESERPELMLEVVDRMVDDRRSDNFKMRLVRSYSAFWKSGLKQENINSNKMDELKWQ